MQLSTAGPALLHIISSFKDDGGMQKTVVGYISVTYMALFSLPIPQNFDVEQHPLRACGISVSHRAGFRGLFYVIMNI